MSLFPIISPGVAPDATVVFTDSSVDGTDGTVFTFTTQSIGTAASNRKIVVSVSMAAAGAGRSVSTLTVGGISATLLVADTSSGGTEQTELWQADVPTGTTATIVVTWTGGSVARTGIGVWAVYNAASSASDTGNRDSGAAQDMTLNITIPAGGVAISAAGSGTSATYTWTNLTEDFDETIESSTTQSGASDAFATLQTEITITADRTAGTSNGTMCAVAFAKG